MDKEARGFLFAIVISLCYVLIWLRYYQLTTMYVQSQLDDKNLNPLEIIIQLWAFQMVFIVHIIIFMFVLRILHALVFRHLEVPSDVLGFVGRLVPSFAIALATSTSLVSIFLLIYRLAVVKNEKPSRLNFKSLPRWLLYYLRVIFLPNVDNVTSKNQVAQFVTFTNLLSFLTCVVAFGSTVEMKLGF